MHARRQLDMLSSLTSWLQPSTTLASPQSRPEETARVAKPSKSDNWSDADFEQPKEYRPSSYLGAEDSTPKARSSSAGLGVPSFNLDDSNLSESAQTSHTAAQSAQAQSLHTTSAPESPKAAPEISIKPSGALMPPPSRKVPTLKSPALGTSSSLGVFTRGPIPNRGPPASQAAQVRSGLAPPSNKKGGRSQVVLKPGHSPLDWATLSQSKNLAGVPCLQRVTPSALKKCNGRKGNPAWSSYNGKVYNIAPYLPFHPGGEGELLRAAGKDGTKLFMEVHSWINWENMLNSCLVGIMVSETEDEGLDGMD